MMKVRGAHHRNGTEAKKLIWNMVWCLGIWESR